MLPLLPLEVQLMIVEWIDGKPDIFAVLLSNSRFQKAAERLLYHNLDFALMDTFRQACRCFETITKYPRLAKLVASLKLDFDGAHVNWFRYIYELCGPALSALTQMETLTIEGIDHQEGKETLVLGRCTYPRLRRYVGPAFIMSRSMIAPVLEEIRMTGSRLDISQGLQNLSEQDHESLQTMDVEMYLAQYHWISPLKFMTMTFPGLRYICIRNTPYSSLSPDNVEALHSFAKYNSMLEELRFIHQTPISETIGNADVAQMLRLSFPHLRRLLADIPEDEWRYSETRKQWIAPRIFNLDDALEKAWNEAKAVRIYDWAEER